MDSARFSVSSYVQRGNAYAVFMKEMGLPSDRLLTWEVELKNHLLACLQSFGGKKFPLLAWIQHRLSEEIMASNEGGVVVLAQRNYIDSCTSLVRRTPRTPRSVRSTNGSEADSITQLATNDVRDVLEAMFMETGARSVNRGIEQVRVFQALGVEKNLWNGDIFLEGFDSKGRMTIVDVLLSSSDETVHELEYAASLNYMSYQNSGHANGKRLTPLTYEVFGISMNGAVASHGRALIAQCARRVVRDGDEHKIQGFVDNVQANLKTTLQKYT